MQHCSPQYLLNAAPPAQLRFPCGYRTAINVRATIGYDTPPFKIRLQGMRGL